MSINEYRKRKQLTDSEKKLSPKNDLTKDGSNRNADPVTPENCSNDNELNLSLTSKPCTKGSGKFFAFLIFD